MAKRRNGNPKTADGFIRISNELWDAWMCSRFTAREERMIKVVIRFSYGMNRSFALLSKSDLARFMNEHLPNVDKILKSLLARGVLRLEAVGTKGPLRLFLNKRYREWQVDQALRKDPDFFGKVARRMFGDGAAPDETGYQSDKPGDQNDNVGVIDSITDGLSDREPPGDRSDNWKQDQDAETVDDIPSGRHKQTEEDIGLSTSSVKVQSPVPDGHPFFAPLMGDQAFWNALAVAYPTQDIPAQVRKMTAWLMANPECEYVFFREALSPEGKLEAQPIRNFMAAWRTACRKAKLSGKVFHDLRRSGVRNLVRSGVSETVAMKISGHKTRSIFQRYNITNEEDLKQAAQRLDTHLKEIEETRPNKITGTIPEITGTITGTISDSRAKG